MVTPRQVVLAAEMLIGAIVLAGFWASLRRSHSIGRVTLAGVAIGVLTGALDTFGIDGVATTALIYRTFGLVEDSRIPGTVLVGFSLPAVAQAVVLTTTFETHFNSLLLLALAAAVGAWLGSHVLTRLAPTMRRHGLGVALVGSGVLMFT